MTLLFDRFLQILIDYLQDLSVNLTTIKDYSTGLINRENWC